MFTFGHHTSAHILGFNDLMIGVILLLIVASLIFYSRITK